MPQRATSGAAAFDLQCVNDWRVPIGGNVVMVDTGWRWEIPEGYCGLVLPRSGLSAKHGITVANSPGLIDCDYRGEVKVLLINHGNHLIEFKHGDRVAQMLIVPQGFLFDMNEVPELSETRRGDGGFGSTGVAA